MWFAECRSTQVRSCCETGSPAPRSAIREAVDRLRRRRPIVSYREFHEVTGRIAALLRDRGVATNDRVALLANNSIEHLLCYFGVMAYGATICTVHVEMNRNELDNIFMRLAP